MLNKEEKLSSKLGLQGSVVPAVKKINGVPVVTPTTGYEGHYPVQFADEADGTFAGRLAQFLESYASAVRNENGGNLEDDKAALTARYDAEVLALEAVYASKKEAAVK